NKGITHMDKFTQNNSFTQWLSPINQNLFDNQVRKYQLNYYTKKLFMKPFISLLLHAQLHETESLQAISDGLFSEELQQSLGLHSISTSQLGRRLNEIPTSFFQSLFLDLVSQIHEKTHFNTRRKVTMPLKIIDSSTLPLNLGNHQWAEFRKTKSGVKLHLRLVFPDQAVIMNAKEHNLGQLEVLVDDQDCMYVFDRGYLDYKRFDRMTDEGYFFVLRLRKNAIVRVIDTFSFPANSTVLSNEMVVIGTMQNRTENVFRKIRILDSKNNILALLTNRFDLSTDEIA